MDDLPRYWSTETVMLWRDLWSRLHETERANRRLDAANRRLRTQLERARAAVRRGQAANERLRADLARSRAARRRGERDSVPPG